MRNPLTKFVAAALALLVSIPSTVAIAENPQVSVAASESGVVDSTACVLLKYRGTSTGKPTYEVAAGGDLTLKIAGVADVTTGSASNGIFDLSTPAAGVDTVGEFVNLVNTQGSNWVAVLVSCLASDLTDNAFDDIAATDVSGPKGVAITREATSASATAIFSAQAALLPDDAETNIQFFLGVGPSGSPTSANKPNANPFANYQTFVQHIREKITSTGVVALFEVLAVKRTYDSAGKVSETVRTIYSETGAATTVEKTVNFHNGPLVTAPGELVIVRQRTATDLTAAQIAGSGYMVRR